MSVRTPLSLNVFTYGPDLPRVIYAAVMAVHRETYDLSLSETDGDWKADGSKVKVTETTQQYESHLSFLPTSVIYKGAAAYVSHPTVTPRDVPSVMSPAPGGLYDIDSDGKRGHIMLSKDLSRAEMLTTAVELTVALSPHLLRHDLPRLTFMDPMFVNWMSGSEDAIFHIKEKGVTWA